LSKSSGIGVSKAIDRNYGVYAQDQWTVGRLTLNLGVRYDYLHAYVPPQVRPAGPYVPSFEALIA
jgi:outer membrane receptor protein involved in Fe transport